MRSKCSSSLDSKKMNICRLFLLLCKFKLDNFKIDRNHELGNFELASDALVPLSSKETWEEDVE